MAHSVQLLSSGAIIHHISIHNTRQTNTISHKSKHAVGSYNNNIK